ncbi:MAG: HEAT repeat domain-containing protein, partial [Endomicrobia bacterium]|nr:HEAT repeat domain-containing protein [Endomicrobiia bacterium]
MKSFTVFAVLCGMSLAVLSGCAGLGALGDESDGSTGGVTEMAASTVGALASNSTTLGTVMSKLNSDNALIRLGAVKAVAQMGASGAQAVPALIPMLQSPDANTRANAAFALGQIGPKASAAVPDLVKLITDKDEKTQRNAVEAIANIGGANVPALVMPLLINVNPTVQQSAMQLLGQYGTASKDAIPTLVQLASGNQNLRQMALDALVKIGPDSIAALTPLLTSGDT